MQQLIETVLDKYTSELGHRCNGIATNDYTKVAESIVKALEFAKVTEGYSGEIVAKKNGEDPLFLNSKGQFVEVTTENMPDIMLFESVEECRNFLMKLYGKNKWIYIAWDYEI